jgi:hypothetical protein
VTLRAGDGVVALVLMNISDGAWIAIRGAAALDKCPDAPGWIRGQDADAIILDA